MPVCHALHEFSPILPLVCYEGTLRVLLRFQVDDDSRFDAGVKAELHARLDVLASSLWSLVDAREVASFKHIAAIQADGWASDVQQSISAKFARFMQLEVRLLVSCVGVVILLILRNQRACIRSKD